MKFENVIASVTEHGYLCVIADEPTSPLRPVSVAWKSVEQIPAAR